MANNTKLSWYVKDESSYTLTNNYYAGDINADIISQIDVRVYNNRFGTTNVDTVPANAKLIVKTITLDDAYLIDLIQISINNGLATNLTKIDETSGYITINNQISGNINAVNNYLDISVIIPSTKYRINDNIKNIVLDIVYG